MEIRFRVHNVEKVQAFLKTITRRSQKEAVKAFTEYVIGDSNHGLRHDDPYQQTTRKAVYGQQWKSDKQRAYVMARIRSGEIKLGQRQHSPTEASQGYGYKLRAGGYGATITNAKEGAYWSRVWNKWPKWRTVGKVIADNMAGAIRSAIAAVNRALREKGR